MLTVKEYTSLGWFRINQPPFLKFQLTMAFKLIFITLYIVLKGYTTIRGIITNATEFVHCSEVLSQERDYIMVSRPERCFYGS